MNALPPGVVLFDTGVYIRFGRGAARLHAQDAEAVRPFSFKLGRGRARRET